jgi:hypothetical protein
VKEIKPECALVIFEFLNGLISSLFFRVYSTISGFFSSALKKNLKVFLREHVMRAFDDEL